MKDILEIVLTYIQNLPQTLYNALLDIFEMIWEIILWIRNTIAKIVSIIILIVHKIPTIVTKIPSVLTKLGSILARIILAICKGIPATIIKIVSSIPKVGVVIGKMLPKIPRAIVAMITGLAKLIVKLPVGIVKGLVAFVTKLPKIVASIVSGICKTLYKLFAPKSGKQGIFLVIIGVLLIFGTLVHLDVITFVQFDIPTDLVEGPSALVAVEVPRSFPLAAKLSDGKSYYTITSTVTTTWMLIAVLGILFRLGTRNLSIVPNSFQAILETIYTFLEGIITQMMGSWRKRYFSYISALLLFIVASNICSFFPVPKITGGKTLADGTKASLLYISPLFRTPTADMNTTLGLAFLTAGIFTAVNLKTSGVKEYIKGFASPIFAMFPLNVLGEIAKPVSMGLRLFGNMFAGMVIMGLLYMATRSYGPLAAVVAPLHLYFDLMGGIIQGVVFSILAMIYIGGAYGDRDYDTEMAEKMGKQLTSAAHAS